MLDRASFPRDEYTKPRLSSWIASEETCFTSPWIVPYFVNIGTTRA